MSKEKSQVIHICHGWARLKEIVQGSEEVIRIVLFQVKFRVIASQVCPGKGISGYNRTGCIGRAIPAI